MLRKLEDSDELERTEPLCCPLCGSEQKSHADLEKHYQIHANERQKMLKKLGYYRAAKKSNKIRKMLQHEGDDLKRLNEAHRAMYDPARGYGLTTELRNAGVKVALVGKGRNVPDETIKKRWRRIWRTSTIDWLILISDDSGFASTIRDSMSRGVRTLVVGENGQGPPARIWEVTNGYRGTT